MWFDEIDLSKLSEATKKTLVRFSDALPVFEAIPAMIPDEPFWDPVGREMVTLERSIRTPATDEFYDALNALMSCPEPEIRVYTRKLDLDWVMAEAKGLDPEAPNEPEELDEDQDEEFVLLDTEMYKRADQRMKDLREQIHKLGLRIKDSQR
jgi:hypothetical protein